MMLEPGPAPSTDPFLWPRWQARLLGPDLPVPLTREFTQALGSYFATFVGGGLFAAVLTIMIALNVGSTLALVIAGISIAGFGMVVAACHEARTPIESHRFDVVEARFVTGAIMASAGVGGIAFAVMASGADFTLQAVIAMVALAALGVGNGTGPGRPIAVLGQALSLSLPVALAILLFWPTPWGVVGSLGVLVYGLACISVGRRSYAVHCELLLARERQRAERLRVDTALRHLNQAMVLLDQDLRIVLINKSAMRLLGVDFLDPDNLPLFPVLLSSSPNLARASSNRDEFLAHAALLVAARQPFNGVLRLNDDRVIDLECIPVPDVGWVAMLRDTTGEHNAIAELNREVRRCPLTGLPNRRAFMEELDRRMGRDETTALLLIDLDGFKQINERHGHSVGDRMITRIGFRLRTADTSLFAARLSSDEFGVLMTAGSAEEAMRMAELLLQTVDSPARFGEAEVQVGAAIGVALAPLHAQLGESLLRAADLALLAAKAEPGNQIRLYSPAMADQSERTATLETRVRAAVRSRQLQVAYQPMIDAATGRAIAVEALARMPDDGGDPVPPHQLVAIAEARGIVGDLRRQVLRQAARTVMTLDPALNLWVNASVQDLRQPSIVEELLADLAEAGLPINRCAIEITETALMTDEAACLANLQRLCELGAGVAMDDFGAGFSSLDRLRRLPINALKISGSLLTGAGRNPVAADIFRVAAGLGQSMGVVLVAEGVETADDLLLARQAGIHRFQGYALSPPVSADDLPAALVRAEQAARIAA